MELEHMDIDGTIAATAAIAKLGSLRFISKAPKSTSARPLYNRPILALN